VAARKVPAMSSKDPKVALADRLTVHGLPGWRWFIDGVWIVFEPPGRSDITLAEMKMIAELPRVEHVTAVFRSTPHAGIYLQFQLRDERPERRFPIITGQSYLKPEIRERWPQSVPWSFVEPFRRRIEHNHSQTLEEIASRGGLGPDELWLAAHDQPLSRSRQTVEPPTEQACGNWLIVAMAAIGEPAA